MIKIILATNSPRRKEIFKMIKLKFKVIPPKIDESSIIKNHSYPIKYCRELAYQKAYSIAKGHNKSYVIGADTIVYNNNYIVGKPKDKSTVIKNLKSLSGKSHIVYTAVNIINISKNINKSFIEKTIVTFNTLSCENVNFYINYYNPFDKAGGYGIQDGGSIFIKKIDGCYLNVVGFPLSKFYKLFNKIILNHDKKI